MRLRILIILVLCGFGIAPIAVLMGINAPAVFGRLEQAAQQESLLRLQNEQYALNVRVERLKERIASLATLPGVRDVLGFESDHSIDGKVAGKRLSVIVNKWFGRRHEVSEIALLDAGGRVRFRLVRSAKGKEFVVAAGNSVHPATDFCKIGVTLPTATVRVSGIEVMAPAAGSDTSQVYGLSLVTPVATANGEAIGSLCCRINMTDFLREYAKAYWLDGDGNPLHGHEIPNAGEARGISTDAVSEEFAGLKALLAANKAVVWSGEHGRQVAWQPILFNEGMAATLWVGHAVDRIALAKWLETQQLRVIGVVVVLILIVVLLAGKIATFIDRRKGEVLAGFDAILSGEKPKPFAWGYFKELRQMAGDLNALADRYYDMRLARQRAEDELRESNARLEELVERRTAELFATNEQLSEEVEERSRAEDELIRHRDHLEDLVRQRLVELAESNEQLQLEMVRRKHAQDSVRQNEARLRTILDSVPIGIFIVDREKRTIAYANPAAAGMIGAGSPADLFGKTCHTLFCESDRDQRRCIDADGSFEQADITLRRLDDAPLSVLKTVIPLTLGDRPCLLESITDITELKRMASQNQTLHQQLLQSQKMEAVGVLAGGVAHDFNNLLTIIHGSADLALLTSSTEKAEHRYLSQIKETTERAGNLVRQLLL
ncbi:MAG: PAS domain-containing protein, partial [Desulfobulbaceae bacterium]|nr:PAS domain-containing protein [Desulfobulbaceae bacterium]